MALVCSINIIHVGIVDVHDLWPLFGAIATIGNYIRRKTIAKEVNLAPIIESHCIELFFWRNKCYKLTLFLELLVKQI